MKIEWKNEEMTEALITKGWFKKRSADVKLGTRTIFHEEGDYSRRCFVFSLTDRYVGFWANLALETAKASIEEQRKREKEWKRGVGQEWQASSSLPPARVVKS